MNRQVVILLIGIIACAGLGSAQARPPYAPIIGDYYKDSKAIVVKSKGADKCNLCHAPAPMPKKFRNEFGMALSKHITADDFKKLMGPAPNPPLVAKLEGALKATEAEKHSSGKTFGDVIKDGKLPGEK